jgi:hypothetical protein
MTNVRFTGLGPYETPIMDKKTYNEIRAKRKNVNDLPNGESEYSRANAIYRFLGFCHNFGLFQAVSLQRDANRVILEGIDNDLLQGLHHYAGVRSGSSKVVPILPLRSRSQLDTFMIRESITSWVEHLPQNIREAPIFADGEFSRVLGYQLGMNIIEHANNGFEGQYGALGAIAMRIMKSEDFSILRNTFPGNLQHVFDDKTNNRGLLEVCVGDRGVGIVKTLAKTYTELIGRSGKKVTNLEPAIIEFAFDEVGTRKPISERLGGVHALHRILRCTIKYHGILKLRTAGYEFIYDATSVSKFERGELGLGIKPSIIRRVRHPWGTQIQLLLPLSKPLKSSASVLPRGSKSIRNILLEPNARIIAVAAHMRESGKEYPAAKFDLNELSILTSSLMMEPAERLVVYDFGGRIWKEDELVVFLQAQKSVLHTHLCIGLNCHTGVAKSLRDREIFESSDWPEWRGNPNDLFDVLSTKHRLFIILDTDYQITWLGLGRYALDGVLQYLMSAEAPVDFTELVRRAESLKDSAAREILTIYLDSNKGLFAPENNASGIPIRWKAILSHSDLESLVRMSVRTSVGTMLRELECIHDRGLYKLPSRFGFARRYYQSTPLFQDRIASQQLAEWMSSAIKDRLKEDEKKLLLVCTTAPVELAALHVANTMITHDVLILNLGYYSALDRDNILNKTDWDLPTFILADTIDSGRTVSEITKLLNNFQLTLRGIIALMRFTNGGAEDVFGQCMFWDPAPGNEQQGEIPRFFVTETKRPEYVSDQQAWDLSQSALFFIEPFSLEIFDYESLSRSNPKKGRYASSNVNDLLLLEKIDSLRYGHLIYGTHHFVITVDIKRLLSSDEILGPIFSRVIDICHEKKISHVLYPLHSNIGRILPKISTTLLLHHGVDLDHTFCVSTKTLTERPFYLLPVRVKAAIRTAADRILSGGEGIRFLILDDAVASGRTLETLVRAIVLESREIVNEKRLKKCPVEMVSAFSILDRQGLAKGTIIRGIDKISIAQPSYSHEKRDPWSFDFSYDRWLALDMPVAEGEACELCIERRYLAQFIETSQLPNDHSVLVVLRERINELRVNSTESPAFMNQKQVKLPIAIKIGRVEATTFELAYLEFLSQIQSGYPMNGLIKQYMDIFRAFTPQEILHSSGLSLLRQEMLRTFIKKWQSVTSQWAGPLLKNALLPIIQEGGALARVILLEAGLKIGERHAKTSVLLDLFKAGIDALVEQNKAVDEGERKQENLYIGCALFCLLYAYRQKEDDYKPAREKHQEIMRDISDYLNQKTEQRLPSQYAALALRHLRTMILRGSSKEAFLPSLYYVLNHTIRAARSAHHAHLIPALLTRLIKAEKFSNREYRILWDTLSYFRRCMEFVTENFPELLDQDTASVHNSFMHYISQLIDVLSSDRNVDEKSMYARALASQVRNLFPHQVTSPIFQKLAQTQVPLFDILKSIETQAHIRNISVLFNKSLEIQKSIFVMARNRELIESILENYTIKLGSDQSDDKILISYFEVDIEKDLANIRRVWLRIRTNYRSYEDVEKSLTSGPGMAELGARDFELFGLRGYCRAERYRKDEVEFTSLVVIEFCQGFEPPKGL